MPTLSELARRLWRHRPVLTTAGRLEDFGDEQHTDGALWAWRWAAEQANDRARVGA